MFITVTFKINPVLNKPLFTIICYGMNRELDLIDFQVCDIRLTKSTT
jgi:hypothetical protein